MSQGLDLTKDLPITINKGSNSNQTGNNKNKPITAKGKKIIRSITDITVAVEVIL